MFLGGSVIVFTALVALFAPFIATHDPNSMNLEYRYWQPSMAYFFGLDQNGSDVFSKMVYGARISFYVAISVVSICLTIGLVLGVSRVIMAEK